MDWQSLSSGVVSLGIGLPMLFFPQRRRKAAERKRAARLLALQLGEEERFFEERRSLDAYPPLRDRASRMVGALCCTIGIMMIVLAWGR